MKLLRNNVKLQIILFLITLFVITAAHLPISLAILLLILCVGSTVLSDLLFLTIRKQKLFIPYSGIITGFILTLIIDPSAEWWQIILTGVFAMAIKNFLRIKNRHIFNPAASGLLISWLLFGLNPSWWGASLYDTGKITLGNILVMLPILGLFFVSGYRLKRYVSIGSFLAVFAPLYGFITASPLQSILATLVSPGNLFYAFLMLPEPMTSPIKKKRQLLYGAAVALLNGFFLFLFSSTLISPDFNVPDATIVSLLIGNLLFFKFR